VTYKQGTRQLGTTETVAFTGTAAHSAVMPECEEVRLQATAACFIATGPTAVATTAGWPLAAGAPEYVRIRAGDRVSAIQQTEGGSLYVTKVVA